MSFSRWYPDEYQACKTLSLSLSLSLSLCPRFKGHFPGERVSRYLSKQRMMEVVVTTDYLSYKSCKAPVISSPLTYQHPVFFTRQMPFLSPNQHCQSTLLSHYMDLLTASSPGVFRLFVWPLTAPGYFGGGLSCLSPALWCQYPNIRPVKLCTKTAC